MLQKQIAIDWGVHHSGVSRKLSAQEPLDLFRLLDLSPEAWLEILPVLAKHKGLFERWPELIGNFRMAHAKYRRAQEERTA